MDDLSRNHIYQPQTDQGDVRVRQNRDTANYRNQATYAGSHSLGFGSNLPTAKSCCDSQLFGIGSSLYGADYHGNTTTYRLNTNPHVIQRHCYTTSVTNSNNYRNETLPYGAGRSSSDNLQFYGSLYGQHREPRQEITDGHCTTCSYQHQPSKINDVTSRKRKVDGEKPDSSLKQEIKNNVSANMPKVDKRALYSKFRVVKKKDQSQVTNESTKVKPFLLRFRLGDQTIVDVNDLDGLPKVTKMAKIVPTLTPMKANDAEATIGNIKFITLDNMKVVRRKLEVVQLVRQEDERQERLKAEAEVKAKVKANAKARMRTKKMHKDRRHGHV